MSSRAPGRPQGGQDAASSLPRPAGLELAQSHAGQPIAVLVDPMRHRGKEIAPAGASVTGRRWLEQRGGARDPTGLAHLRDEETFELLRLPGVGLFMLPASAARTPAGLELSWVTE